ncbi:Cys-tRNA(Pro)/Cys-tRNA(Cys) deacylase [Mumia flava]|uniref:Cys-tRNA(Pro)/Cys-tRNA(Cys) deacylase n=1 Tax=Mumia flava TaxID=1348852 RepID=A0A0B2BUR6_9ACTN|nr:Cys-tRNA(Pro) deacylase [Mumia flava]PJJ56006.1 Cys-tRNA(Pro)/Cys-tRNA(Cys) deacylase [Mumia flava]
MAKRKNRGAGTGTPATALLESSGATWTAHPYEHDPRAASYGLEAAQALGVAVSRVYKTLLADCDGELTVAVVPVDRQLDLKALARAVGAKRAAMAEPARAERSTGYVVGGISPLGQRTALRTVVDDSVGAWPTIFVSGGRRGLDIELTPQVLIELTAAGSAPIAR